MARFLLPKTFLVPILLFFFAGVLFSGTTGKISGVIKDATTGEELPGTNIVIEGTSLGAASDLSGRFNIIGIPPGIFTVKVSMIGYKVSHIENVRVSIDMTTPLNVNLESTVLEAGEEVTIVADRPLVKMDMTSSMSSVGSKEIDALPVQDMSDVLQLQAGVVNSGGMHIRGGRAGEVAYWVDGVSTTDVFSGGSGVVVENSAIQELQVVSGTFNAEYGQAMSGIVNIITKEGGQKYSGQIKGFVGDYVSSDDIYDVWKRVDATTDSLTNATTVTETTENPLEKFNPIYNGEFSLSGPVPFLADRVTFFANGRYLTDEGYLYGREWYLPTGLPGDSSLVPMNPYKRLSGQLKFTYQMSSEIKISYNGFWNEYQQDRTFNRTYKYNPNGVSQNLGGGFTHILSLNHVLSPKTFYELKINRFYSESKSYVYDDPNARPHWLVKVPADSLNPERILDTNNADDMVIFEQIKFEGLEYDFIADPKNAEGYVHADSASDPASYSFYRAGNNLNRSYRSTAYWLSKLDFTSQVNNTHQLKFGAELRIHELKLDNYTLQPATKEGKDEQIVPFVPSIPDVSTIYHNKYTRNPREFSAYVQDKMELKDVILNLGLRFDYFDANGVVPADPTDINIYDPFKSENIWKSVEDSIKYTPEERRAFMHKKVDPKMQISPRLGIAYPITDKGVIHFSYGHFFQIPEFQYLYDSPDFKLNSGGGQSIIGNADLNPQKTVQYEIGLQQQIGEDIGIDITMFYRDIRDWVGTSPIIRTYRRVVGYSIYENKDYSNVRGFTLKVEKRMTNNISARIDYSYQAAEGTYSNPSDAFYAIQNEQEPRLNLIPLNWDQRNTLNGQVMYNKNGYTASVIGKYYTGTPYTPSFAQGERVGGTALTGLTENSARKPTIYSVDLYLTKRFKVNQFEVSAFFYAYNVFDQRGESNVFGDTGTAAYTTYPHVEDVDYSPARISTVQDLLNRPEWYITPREVQLGFTLGF